MAIKPKKMSMKTKKSKRIIAWILICALALSLVPASIVLAEEAYPPYQMTEENGKVLEYHNTTTPIPLADIPDILGISDISTALTRVVDNGNSVWTSTDLGDMTLEADKTYTVQNGEIKMPSWNPSTWYTEWTDSYQFTTKAYDVLTVEANIAGKVSVDGSSVTGLTSFKVYRGETPTVSISMDGLEDYTVSAKADGETVLTEAGTYTFENGLTKDAFFQVIYVENAESTVSAGAVSQNVNIAFAPTAKPGETVTITADPAAGYYVSEITVTDGNNQVPVTITYDNGMATASFTVVQEKANYIVNCSAAPILVLSGDSVNYNNMMPIETVEKNIKELIDTNASAPSFANGASVQIEYDASSVGNPNWKPLDFKPNTVESLIMHSFGKNGTENIRFSYAGDGQAVRNGELIFTVVLTDNRKTSAIDIAEAVEVVYNDFTAESLMNALTEGDIGIYDAETGEPIQDAKLSFASDPTKLNAGTHDVTVKFDGNAEYNGATFQVSVTIAKADVTISVDNATKKPNSGTTTGSLISVSDENVGYVSFVVAADALEGNASVYVDMSNIVHMDGAVKDVIDSVLGTQKTFTISEFRDLVNKIQELCNTLNIDLDLTYLNQFADFLASLESVEGVGDLQLIVSTDGNIRTDNVGVYIVGAMTTNPNYNVAVDVGSVIVTPNITEGKLSFNQDIGNTVSIEAVRQGAFDMGVSLEGTENNVEITNLFFGVTVNGIMYTGNTPPTDVGAYTQIAYAGTLGNDVFYADPIMRTYAIVPDEAEISFEDSYGNLKDNLDSVYNGNQADIVTVAKDKNGNRLNSENIEVFYTGVTFGFKTYASSEAPTEAGKYTVTVVYREDDLSVLGARVETFTIEKADSEISVESIVAEEDGNEHFVKVNNPNKILCASFAFGEQDVFINVPEQWNLGQETINKDFILKLIESVGEFDNPMLNDILDKLETRIGSLDNYSLFVNNGAPTAVGNYTVYLLAYDANYKTFVAEETVKILEKEHVHNLIAVDAKAPTCTEDGNIAYWHCPDCGLYFSDKSGTQEIALESTLLKALGHDYQDGTCTECGDKDPDYMTPTEPSEPSEPSEPTTPDDGEEDDSSDTPKLGFEGKNHTILCLFTAFASMMCIIGALSINKIKKNQNGKYLAKEDKNTSNK